MATGSNSGGLSDIAALQEAIVRSAISDLAKFPRDSSDCGVQWKRIVINLEARWDGSETETSVISFGVVEGTDGSLRKSSFRLSENSHSLFQQLATMMKARDGAYWSVVDLVINASGEFSFVFSHEPPYRLDGHLHDTRFADYLQRYAAERVEE
ncbi:MAG: hypothetical protein IR164_04930 [Devosia sp.]|uniref:hypothetical protein n=1 Tax=unclassified Devosia TaxID=196773 RepID=UPI0019FE882A|nr:MULTISPECIES: hypothetical protein [unclassified Devosia]MBF0678267.1 hypothetical protein [Devosia sp.]WEJ31523.1 hypothetical protein NYQ88_11415 [Devosia sp. SD17-2]